MADAQRETDVSESFRPADVRAVEYARGVHRENLDFNRDLYTRAQIVLTLDGVVLAAVAAGVARDPADVAAIVRRFSSLTWVLLALATAALIVSVLSAAQALYSRHRRRERWRPQLLPARWIRHQSQSAPGPWHMWYFGGIAEMPAEEFVDQALLELKNNPDYEAHVRLAHVWVMSATMVRRADQLNRAFVCTALALVFFALAVADYLVLFLD